VLPVTTATNRAAKSARELAVDVGDTHHHCNKKSSREPPLKNRTSADKCATVCVLFVCAVHTELYLAAN
jgi:hypothetical protein